MKTIRVVKAFQYQCADCLCPLLQTRQEITKVGVRVRMTHPTCATSYCVNHQGMDSCEQQGIAIELTVRFDILSGVEVTPEEVPA